MCKNIRCRKRFEVTTLQSVAELNETRVSHGADRAERLKAAFGRKTLG